MKADKLRNMDGGELQRETQEAQEQLFRFRFQMGMGQSEGLKKYRALRKDRARMLTILNEKRVGGETIPVENRQVLPAPKKSAAVSKKKK